MLWSPQGLLAAWSEEPPGRVRPQLLCSSCSTHSCPGTGWRVLPHTAPLQTLFSWTQTAPCCSVSPPAPRSRSIPTQHEDGEPSASTAGHWVWQRGAWHLCKAGGFNTNQMSRRTGCAPQLWHRHGTVLQATNLDFSRFCGHRGNPGCRTLQQSNGQVRGKGQTGGWGLRRGSQQRLCLTLVTQKVESSHIPGISTHFQLFSLQEQPSFGACKHCDTNDVGSDEAGFGSGEELKLHGPPLPGCSTWRGAGRG